MPVSIHCHRTREGKEEGENREREGVQYFDDQTPPLGETVDKLALESSCVASRLQITGA